MAIGRGRVPITFSSRSTGLPLAGASVQINVRSSGAPATLYSGETGTGVVSNPTTTDAGGAVSAWLNRGQYVAIISGTGISNTTPIPFDIAPAGDRNVDSAWIEDGSITNIKIPTGAVGTDELANGAVTEAKILNGSISVDKLKDGIVTSAKIADNTIQLGDIANGVTISAPQYPGMKMQVKFWRYESTIGQLASISDFLAIGDAFPNAAVAVSTDNYFYNEPGLSSFANIGGAWMAWRPSGRHLYLSCHNPNGHWLYAVSFVVAYGY